MEYLGYPIEDRVLVTRYQPITAHCASYQNYHQIDENEIVELLELVRNKRHELEENKIEYDYVGISFCGEQARRNDYGPDDPASFETCLVWTEQETDEEAAKRIEKMKARIKNGIEIEKRKKEEKEREQKRKLEEAIKIVKENGGTVNM